MENSMLNMLKSEIDCLFLENILEIWYWEI